jgi:ParB-like chromosome segregation protein Spo0J
VSKDYDQDEEKSVIYDGEQAWVRTDRMKSNPWNPNVMDHDTLQQLKVNVQAGDYDPLILTPDRVYYGDMSLPGDRYVIVDGRWRREAAIELGVLRLKSEIQNLSEAEARRECYSRGKVRGQLDPVREGALFDLEVTDLGSEDAVAQKYNLTRSYVAGRRSLVRAAEPVRRLIAEPEALLEIKKAEIKEQIVEENPGEKYTPEQLEEMAEATIEEDEVVPRGTITPSHVEALVGLPEKAQAQVAVKVVEERLSVRDTEEVVRLVNLNIERRKRFEEALSRAVQKTCPRCGSPPKDFDQMGYVWEDGEQKEERFDETRFACSKCWEDWAYMKKAKPPEREEERMRRERSERLRQAQANPGYIRREETTEEIIGKVSPWILRKLKQLDGVIRVSVRGTREGKVVEINFPESYGQGLHYTVGEPRDDVDYYTRNERRFGFSQETKAYKSLPYKTKLDVHGEPSPERRAEVHWFLDQVVGTNADPFLPEDPQVVKNLLEKYGETPSARATEPKEEELACEICGSTGQDLKECERCGRAFCPDCAGTHPELCEECEKKEEEADFDLEEEAEEEEEI